MKTLKTIFFFALISLLINCEAKDVEGELKPDPISGGSGSDGNGGSSTDLLTKDVLVVGSGNLNNIGTVNHISSTGILSQEIFNNFNASEGKKLSSSVNSYARNGNIGYLTDNDRLILVYNENFQNPADFGSDNETIIETGEEKIGDIALDGTSKIYATTWGKDETDPKITVFTIKENRIPNLAPDENINLTLNKPDRIIFNSGKLIITHINQSSISIVNPITKVVNTIELQSIPTKLVALSNGNVAALCEGDKNEITINARIYEIDVPNETAQVKIQFNPGEEVGSFDFSNNHYFFTIKPKIYRIKPNDSGVINFDTSGFLLNSTANTEIEVDGSMIYTIFQNTPDGQGILEIYNADSGLSILRRTLKSYGKIRIYLEDRDFEYE